MKYRWIAALYFLTGIACILFQNLSMYQPGFFAKAMIIPALMVFFLTNVRIREERMHTFLLMGLFFSWAGDIFLDLPSPEGKYFVPGLACFLIAHIFYMIVFFLTPGKNTIVGKGSWMILPVILYGILLVSLLYKNLGEMRLPVIIYAIVILTMLSASINRKEKVNRKSFRVLLAGAILFVISDSLIAVNKFSYQFEYSGIAVMCTYILAQFLIVSGYIIQFRKMN